MPRIGYARVSSTDQDLALQIERLKAAGCEMVRSEKVTGSTGLTHEISVAGPSLMNNDVPSRLRGEDHVHRKPGSASRCC